MDSQHSNIMTHQNIQNNVDVSDFLAFLLFFLQLWDVRGGQFQIPPTTVPLEVNMSEWTIVDNIRLPLSSSLEILLR